MGDASQDSKYLKAVEEHGPALARLARAYEANEEKRRDLLQEIHLQLWRSLQRFDGRCSLRTWVYRVGHHVAATHVLKERRRHAKLVTLDDLDALPGPDHSSVGDRRLDLDRLAALIQRLKPLDRQVIVMYLEDLDAASIAEITGLSPAAVAMRVHRIKDILARQFHQGGSDAN